MTAMMDLRRSIGLCPLVFAAALLLGGPPASATEEVFAPDECPDRLACLRATIDLIEEPDDDREVEHHDDPVEGIRQVTFATRGRLRAGPERVYRLRIRAFGGGIACTGFGQSQVALLGFAPSGNPIVHTDDGPFEIVDDAIVIGCTDCLRLSREPDGKLLATFTTPAWDLAFSRLSAEDFSWTENGQVYVQSGEACIRLGRRELFRFAPADRCSRRPEFKGLNPETDMSEEGPDWILKIEGSGVTGYLYKGACT